MDCIGVQQKQDQLLRLAPAAIAAVQEQKRAAVRRHIVALQDGLQIRNAVRAGTHQLGRDRTSSDEDDESIIAPLGRVVGSEQSDVVDVRRSARRITVMNEPEIRMRIQRIDVPAPGILPGGAGNERIAQCVEPRARRDVPAVAREQINRGDQLHGDSGGGHRHQERDSPEDESLDHALLPDQRSGRRLNWQKVSAVRGLRSSRHPQRYPSG